MAVETIRQDQTVTFTIQWTDAQGNPAPAPAGGLQLNVSDPSKASLTGDGNGTYTVHPLAQTTGVDIVANIGSVQAVGHLAIQGGAATGGVIVWGTPTPA